MDIRQSLIAVWMTVFLILQKGEVTEGIRCYSCFGRGCGDDFDFSSSYVTIHNCQNGQCNKHKGPDGTVSRYCSPMKLVNDGCTEIGDIQAVCACSTDLCNTATVTRVSIATVSLATIAVLVKLFL